MIGSLLLAGLLGSLSVLLSGIPTGIAWPLAALVLGYGLWLAHREARRPVRSLFFTGGDLPVMVDGSTVERVEVQWRGRLAFVSWNGREGTRVRLSWWPDTLPAARRRELRLAVNPMNAAPLPSAMAP